MQIFQLEFIGKRIEIVLWRSPLKPPKSTFTTVCHLQRTTMLPLRPNFLGLKSTKDLGPGVPASIQPPKYLAKRGDQKINQNKQTAPDVPIFATQNLPNNFKSFLFGAVKDHSPGAWCAPVDIAPPPPELEKVREGHWGGAACRCHPDCPSRTSPKAVLNIDQDRF